MKNNFAYSAPTFQQRLVFDMILIWVSALWWRRQQNSVPEDCTVIMPISLANERTEMALRYFKSFVIILAVRRWNFCPCHQHLRRCSRRRNIKCVQMELITLSSSDAFNHKSYRNVIFSHRCAFGWFHVDRPGHDQRSWARLIYVFYRFAPPHGGLKQIFSWPKVSFQNTKKY